MPSLWDALQGFVAVMPGSWMWGYSTHYWWHFTISQRRTTGFPWGICVRKKNESGWFATPGSGSRTEKKKVKCCHEKKSLTLHFAMHVIQLCRNCLWSWNCGLHNDFLPILFSSSHSVLLPSQSLPLSYFKPHIETQKYTPLTKAAPKPYLFSNVREKKQCFFINIISQILPSSNFSHGR